ncbi:MAG: 30S ribosomal protein S6 [Chitinivibrionales bacterium]|nr:30S ribosomal protein S6 [Chitinivibrionales bacterium]MBD3356627.1 30S ribosomal protein S6 [Chitinivibrionales bacterium]
MERPYETMVLYDGTLPEETIRSEHQRMEQLVGDNAKLDESIDWGKKTLAYEIKGKKTGIYYLYRYRGEGDVPDKLDRSLKMNVGILRYLTIVRDLSKRTFEDLPKDKMQESEDEDSADYARTSGGNEERTGTEGERDA